MTSIFIGIPEYFRIKILKSCKCFIRNLHELQKLLYVYYSKAAKTLNDIICNKIELSRNLLYNNQKGRKMDTAIALHFNTLHGIRLQEVIGNYIIEIEPASFCVFDREKPTNRQHYHNHYELCIITGGVGEYLHDGELYTLGEGDVIIANPGVMHEIRLSRDDSGRRHENLYLVFFNIYIQGSLSKIPESFEEKKLSSFLTSHFAMRKSCRHILSYLSFFKTYMDYNSGKNYSVWNAVKGMALDSLFSLVGDKNNQYKGKSLPSESIVESAIRYISANLSEKLYISDIASNTHTSVRNLQHLFRKYLNKSVSEYICDRRLSVAAGYLKMNFKISDVCPLVGVNDPAQFSRIFKRFYGISPKKYQMLHSPSAGHV